MARHTILTHSTCLRPLNSNLYCRKLAGGRVPAQVWVMVLCVQRYFYLWWRDLPLVHTTRTKGAGIRNTVSGALICLVLLRYQIFKIYSGKYFEANFFRNTNVAGDVKNTVSALQSIFSKFQPQMTWIAMLLFILICTRTNKTCAIPWAVCESNATKVEWCVCNRSWHILVVS